MQRTLSRTPAHHNAIVILPALLLWMGLLAAPLQAGEATDSAETAETTDKAVVVPYKTRPAPTHRVNLHDDRVYFLKKLEQKDDTYVLHTLEGEVIEVQGSDVAEIVEFKSE